MILLSLILTASPMEGVELTELLKGDAGSERLVLIKATRGVSVQLDQSQPLLAIVLTGDVSLPGGERPRAVAGPAGRCEPSISLAFGAELLVLQPTAGREPIVGTPLKQKCTPNSPKLARAESPLNETFDLGPRGSVRFISQTPFAYAGELSFNPGAVIESHQHPTSTELLWMLDGSGTATVAEVARAIAKGDVVRIPAGTMHAFTAGPKGGRAIQLYRPPGPEERFRPKTPAALPPIDTACPTTSDCALFTRVLTGATICCPSCDATAVSKQWLQKLEPACTARNEGTAPCSPLPCGPVERYAICRKGQCVLSPTP